MLFEPQDGATDDDRKRYARELAEADAEADMTIIVSALQPARPAKEEKRVYVKVETTAHFQAAMHLPSKRGNGCLLEDAVQDAATAGNVIRPAKQPAD